MHSDRPLAARLEALAAEEMRSFVRSARALHRGSAAAVLEVAGGVASFFDDCSPLNQVLGVGFERPVTPEDVSEIEAFYATRGQRPLVVASPLADPSLFVQLALRRWSVDGFENVLCRAYVEGDAFEQSSHIEVVEVDDDEGKAVWASVAAAGFSAPLAPLAEQIALAKVVISRPRTRLFLALVDGVPAGTGELAIRDGVAWLSADTTLPAFRRRGVQYALQSRRLQAGLDAGCELAVTEAMPGSASQRNMERQGFGIAYTRVDIAPANVKGSQQ